MTFAEGRERSRGWWTVVGVVLVLTSMGVGGSARAQGATELRSAPSHVDWEPVPMLRQPQQRRHHGWTRGPRITAITAISAAVVGTGVTLLGFAPSLRHCWNACIGLGGALLSLSVPTLFGAWLAERRHRMEQGRLAYPPRRRARRLLGFGYGFVAMGVIAFSLGAALGEQAEGSGNLGMIVGGSLFGTFVGLGIPLLAIGHARRGLTPAVALRVGPASLALDVRF